MKLPVVGVVSFEAKSSQLASNIGAASALSCRCDGKPAADKTCGTSLGSSTIANELNPEATLRALSTIDAAVASVVAVRSEVEA